MLEDEYENAPAVSVLWGDFHRPHHTVRQNRYALFLRILHVLPRSIIPI